MARNSVEFRRGKTVFILSSILMFGCSPVVRTASPTNVNTSVNAIPAPSSNGETLLTLPSWCSVTQSSEQVCFRCEREDGGVQLPYEQCLTPSESFKASTDCAFVNDLTKTISCAGTRSGDPFLMDASLAKEKITAALPAFLIGLHLTVKQEFPQRDDVAQLTSDLTSFLGGRIPQIIRGEDQERIAGDLLRLVNQHLPTPLTDDVANHFKTTAVTAFGMMAQDLAGRKDYKLSRFILRAIAIANSIPAEIRGEAKPYLTGPGLADLLSKNNAQVIDRALKILNPGVLGVKSVDDLLAELREGN